MIGFFTAIIVFNFIALKVNKRLNRNQILHIWTFTIAFQAVTETFLDFKYHGYWYFTKEINWFVLPAFTILIPPVNILFLNWYPLNQSLFKQAWYIFFWVVSITLYELIAMLPEPWGYFRHNWWTIWYSLILNPILLFAVLGYYKLIVKIENEENM